MLRISFSLFALLLVAQIAFAKAIVKEEAYVNDPSGQHLLVLGQIPDLTIDHVDEAGFTVYGPEGLYSALTDLSIPFEKPQVLKQEKSDYMSHEEMESRLKSLAEDYSHIVKYSVVGTSIEGRNIFVIKISDNVEVDEVEPEFKYIGLMHGNEITGREMMWMLVRDLVTSYEKDSSIASLIDNTEIFIMPTMNPDGTAHRRRGNAKWVDLNRDFPDFSTSDNQNTPAGREPETAVVMEFQKQRNFSLSANFHTGAEVVNYPWDTVSERHPLNDIVMEFSRSYANRVDYLRNSRRFPGGIVNGHDWYEVNGGMQDWSSYWYNDLQVTIELSNNKWPSASLMEDYYEANREAMIAYIANIHHGAGFALTETNQRGLVMIRDLSSGLEVGPYSFKDSEFYRVLPEGLYEFAIETANEQMKLPIQVFSDGKFENNYHLIDTL
jgi:hypothetical protein